MGLSLFEDTDIILTEYKAQNWAFRHLVADTVWIPFKHNHIRTKHVHHSVFSCLCLRYH